MRTSVRSHDTSRVGMAWRNVLHVRSADGQTTDVLNERRRDESRGRERPKGATKARGDCSFTYRWVREAASDPRLTELSAFRQPILCPLGCGGCGPFLSCGRRRSKTFSSVALVF